MLRSFSILAILLVAGSSTGAAQDSPGIRDGAAEEISGRIRSFYFNLAHNNWEALTADILAAKVVAHRRAPEIRSVQRKSLAPPELSRAGCPASGAVSVEQAVVMVEGDWAKVTVPHCAPVPGRDEFRLIRFGGRWRFVAVHLFQQPADVTLGR